MVLNQATWLLIGDLNRLMSLRGKKASQSQVFEKLSAANLLFQFCHPNRKLLVFSQ